MKKLFTLFVFALLIISIFAVTAVVAKYNDNSKGGNDDSISKSSDSNSVDSNDKDDKEEGDKDDGDANDKDDQDENDKNNEKEIETEKTIIDDQGREVIIKTEIKMKNGVIVESEEERTYIDENGNKVVIKTETETNGKGETETEVKKTYIDELGNKIVIKTETETNRDGETETEVKRTIKFPDGTKITYKTKTKIKEGKEKITNSVSIKGAEFETKLSVTTKIEEGKAKFKATLSTGEVQDIPSPDEVLLKALKELGTTNKLKFKLIESNGEAKFSAKAKNPGKLFFIINLGVPIETLFDDKGKLIETKKPWWAVFVKELNKAKVCHVSEDDPTQMKTITIGIPAVKAHLAHGDSVGPCSVDDIEEAATLEPALEVTPEVTTTEPIVPETTTPETTTTLETTPTAS